MDVLDPCQLLRFAKYYSQCLPRANKPSREVLRPEKKWNHSVHSDVPFLNSTAINQHPTMHVWYVYLHLLVFNGTSKLV